MSNTLARAFLRPVREEAPGSDDDSVNSNILGEANNHSRSAAQKTLFTRAIESIKDTVNQKYQLGRLLAAIRAGDTLEVLDSLAESHSGSVFEWASSSDGNAVVHLLAEFGDANQLQALINYVKIHAHTCPRLLTLAVEANKRRLASASSGHTGAAGAPLEGADAALHACLNRINHLHQTPLMFAAYHGREEVLRLLMAAGADPWMKDRCGGRTALHYAAAKGHVQCLRALLDGLAANPTTSTAHPPGTPFVEVRTSSGYTPLHFAVASGSVPAIRVLCAYGAKLESSNTHCADDFWVSCSTYTTPLHLAATLGFTEVAMALLRHYADQAEEWAMSKGVATVSTEPPSSEVDTKGLHHTSDGGAETGASGVHTQGGTMFSRVSSTPTGEVSLPTTSTNAEFGPNGRSTTDGEGDCRASQAPAARRMRKVSSMASLTSDGITTTASLKRPLDPRRATDGKGRIPMQVAARKGHMELAASLAPGVRIADLWAPQDLAKWANSGMVAPLQVIVARQLHTRLMHNIAEAEECMKMLGTHTQAGRVFQRTGLYCAMETIDCCDLPQFNLGRDSSAHMWDNGMTQGEGEGGSNLAHGSSGRQQASDGSGMNGGAAGPFAGGATPGLYRGANQGHAGGGGGGGGGRGPGNAPSLLSASSAADLVALVDALGLSRHASLQGNLHVSAQNLAQLASTMQAAASMVPATAASGPSPTDSMTLTSLELPPTALGARGGSGEECEGESPRGGQPSPITLQSPFAQAASARSGRADIWEGGGGGGRTRGTSPTPSQCTQSTNQDAFGRGSAISATAWPSGAFPIISNFAEDGQGMPRASDAAAMAAATASPPMLGMPSMMMTSAGSHATGLRGRSPPLSSMASNDMGWMGHSMVGIKQVGGYGPCAPMAVFSVPNTNNSLSSSNIHALMQSPPSPNVTLGTQRSLQRNGSLLRNRSGVLRGGSPPPSVRTRAGEDTSDDIHSLADSGRPSTAGAPMSVVLVRSTTATALIEHAKGLGGRVTRSQLPPGLRANPGQAPPTSMLGAPYTCCTVPMQMSPQQLNSSPSVAQMYNSASQLNISLAGNISMSGNNGRSPNRPSTLGNGDLMGTFPEIGVASLVPALNTQSINSALTAAGPTGRFSGGGTGPGNGAGAPWLQQQHLHNLPIPLQPHHTLPGPALATPHLPAALPGRGKTAASSLGNLEALGACVELDLAQVDGSREGEGAGKRAPKWKRALKVAGRVAVALLFERPVGERQLHQEQRQPQAVQPWQADAGWAPAAQLPPPPPQQTHLTTPLPGQMLRLGLSSKPPKEYKAFKYWLGYERYYVAKAGMPGNLDASGLRQAETVMEARRRVQEQRKQQQQRLEAQKRIRELRQMSNDPRKRAPRPRLVLCGLIRLPIPYPTCCMDCVPAKMPKPKTDMGSAPFTDPKPGVDVCGMCMDNRPVLEMQGGCRHRVCVLCARAMCGALELRTIVTCPFCTTPVSGFQLV